MSDDITDDDRRQALLDLSRDLRKGGTGVPFLSLMKAANKSMCEARDAERDRIADWIDAQGGTMSKIPDNGKCEHDQWSWTGCEMCGLEETAKALRNNEHRSEA